METIIPSLITGIVTAFGSILGFITTIQAQKQKALEAHETSQKNMQKELEEKLDKHKKEYLERIDTVERKVRDNLDSLADMRAQTQAWQSVMEVKFDNLEQKVMKHNNFMERVAVLEKEVAVLQNRESVSEHRLTDLENHEEK